MESIHQFPEELTKEPYQAPEILIYGSIVDLTLGSGGNDSDGCSAGYWQNDGDDEDE